MGDSFRMRNSKTRIIAIIAVLALTLGLAGYGLLRNQSTEAASDSAAPSTPSTTTQPPAATAPADLPAGCPADPKPIDDPKFMQLIEHGLEMPMLSLGQDGDGAAAAPPGDEGYTIAWFNEGPKVGSEIGKVVLSSHTFQFGGALGNDLNDGLLSDGDIFLISDAAGNSACYRYSGSLHIMVNDYDPDSDIVYDYSGAPQLALVVCSDYTLAGEALGRIIYYADLIAGPQAEASVAEQSVGQVRAA